MQGPVSIGEVTITMSEKQHKSTQGLHYSRTIAETLQWKQGVTAAACRACKALMLMTFMPDQDGFGKFNCQMRLRECSICLSPPIPLAMPLLLLFLYPAHHPRENFYRINSVLTLVRLRAFNTCLSGQAARANYAAVMWAGLAKRPSNKDRKMFLSPTEDLAADIKRHCRNMNAAEEMPVCSSVLAFMCR